MKSNAFVGIAAALLVAGCSKPETKYEDPSRNVMLQNKFSMNDMEKCADDAVQQLIQNGNLEGEDRPMVFLATIQNDTSEHIDTQTIADVIQQKLLASKRFRFTAGGQGQQLIKEQIDWQASAVPPEKAVKAGKQLGAKYVMYGRISDDVQKNGDTISRDYAFNLRAANIETGEVLVNYPARIRKVTTNASIGW
jgi:penicillin-binding protein activator